MGEWEGGRRDEDLVASSLVEGGSAWTVPGSMDFDDVSMYCNVDLML